MKYTQESSMPHRQPFMAPREFLEALGKPFGTVKLYELLRAGKIRSAKLGRKYLVPTSELTDFPKRVVGEDLND